MIKDNIQTEDSSGQQAVGNLDHSHAFTSSLLKRNIVLDESNFIEKFLKCIICEKLYDTDNQQPRILPCHHALCKVCVIKLFYAEAEYRRRLTNIDELPHTVTIICPICAESFISTLEALQKLPTDHRVIQLIDFVGHTERQTVQYCSTHKTQPINFFCECCVKLICRDCTVVDHKEDNGHPIKDIEGALKTYYPIVEEAMAELEAEKSGLKEKRMALEKSIETYDKSEEDVVGQVRNSFAALKAALEEREKELIAMAEKEVEKEKRKYREKIELIDKRNDEIDEKYQELKKCKEEGNVEDMFKATRDYKPQTSLSTKEVDDGIITKFSFNDRDEKYLSNRVQNYGDIITKLETTRSSTSGSYGRSSVSSYSSYTPRYSYYRP